MPPLGHPENAARLRAVVEGLGGAAGAGWTVEEEVVLPPDEQVEGVLRWIHDAGYIERFRDAVAAAPTVLDSPDCPVSSGTYDAALAASGLALASALDLANGRAWRTFLALRPPSHHARRDRAAGFCFFNSVALAAEVVVRAWNLPVLVVDFDADHGAGTQEHFYERGDVGYVSVHRWPTLSGAGGGDEVGVGKGRGSTRNVPLASEAGDDAFCSALEGAVEDVGSRLRPAALVLSAGFNGHRDDPLGGLGLTEDGFARITRTLVQASEAWCGGRILSILEGGFSPAALASAARTHVSGLVPVADTIN